MNYKQISTSMSLSYARLGIAGLSPIMPGTCGSALAAILSPWMFLPLSFTNRILLLLLIFFSGSLAASKAEQLLQKKDPSEVVVDELLGLWLVLLPFKNPDWLFICLAFIIFRVFDIIKLWPVKASENWLPKGYGIMIDDVFAGLQALLLIYFLIYLGWISPSTT